MKIKIDQLYILIDYKSNSFYPKIFTSKQEAIDYNVILGGYHEIKPCFIDSFNN